MRTELEKYLGDDRFAKHTGIVLLSVEPDYALARMDIREFHMNGVDRVHGGAIVTLADYAFAAASNTEGGITLGINTNVSFFKSPSGKYLTAEATAISGPSRVRGYNVDVKDEDGTLIARMSALGYSKKRHAE